MLDMDVMPAVFTKALQQHIRILRGSQRIHEWILPAREVIILNANDEEGCIHTLSIAEVWAILIKACHSDSKRDRSK